MQKLIHVQIRKHPDVSTRWKPSVHFDGVKINKLKDQQFLHKLVDYDLVFLQETHLDKDNIGDIGLPGFAPSIHFLRFYG